MDVLLDYSGILRIFKEVFGILMLLYGIIK
jgi:hypothetical protein